MRIKCGGYKPSYANSNAAGLDIRANEDVSIYPGGKADIESKLSMEIPQGHFGLLVARSGLSFKHQIKLINDVGIIDSDYRGDIGIRLINEGDHSYKIIAGDRIAQLLIIPYIQAELEYVDELEETERGAGGFGSTGK